MHVNENYTFEHFNQLYKELDETYQGFAAKCGLSASAMWIIYSLRAGGDGCNTQAEIAKLYFLKKQSVCSAIRKLEKDGFIVLLPMPNNAKNKILKLTEKGIHFAKEKIDVLLKAEQSTFESLTLREQNQFIKLYEKYIAALKSNINAIK